MNALDSIKNQVISCTKCELCETRKNAVPGKGSTSAKIIFIGEAPGRSEDNAGEPFVGAAGKKLSEALESVGILRSSVYITNVVKCRPPKNRVPSQSEKEACGEYLEKEIALIKPKVICIMGNTAFHSLLGGNNITKHRGKFINKDGKVYFITIHPAATIYNQKLIPILKKDIKELKNYIDSGN